MNLAGNIITGVTRSPRLTEQPYEGHTHLTRWRLGIHVLLILGIGIAMGAGLWNMRAAMRAGRSADWRTNRDGLRAPGSSQTFTLLSMVGPTIIIALAAFGVPLLVLLAAGLAYAITFVALAVRERRLSETYYRGNVGITL